MARNETQPEHRSGLRFDRDRLAFADVLRFLGAFAVVVQHTFELSGVRALNDFTLLVGPGIFGVALFFFISGFVIPFSIRRGINIIDFCIRRVFRIYPLVIVAFALWFALALSGIIHDQRVFVVNPSIFLANFFFYHNFTGQMSFLGVTWTLSLEFLWYGIFIAVILIFGKRAGAVFEIGLPAITAIGMVAAVVTGHRIPIGYFGMIYCAAIGYQAYLYFQDELSSRRFWTSALLMIVLMMIGNFISYGYFHHERTTLAASIVPWLLAPLTFFAVQLPQVRAWPIFRNRMLATLGAISFSTYLLHPLALALSERFASGLPWVISSMLLAILFSFVGYRYVERPGIELGRRLSRRLLTNRVLRNEPILKPD